MSCVVDSGYGLNASANVEAGLPERPDPLGALLRLCRRHVHQWLGSQPDPHAELLALVWGPRFDRVHARHLLAQAVDANNTRSTARFALWQAASLFDQLPPPTQQRLRKVVLRHRALSPDAVRWETMHHAPHTSD